VKDLVDELERRRALARAMGGEERIRRHHESGRLTVRERIERLTDSGAFLELGLLAEPELRREETVPADAVVTGLATVGGRKVCLIGIDATVMAGSTAPTNMRKQDRMVAFAGEKGIPLIVLSDADGGRMPDVMGWRFSGLPFDFRTFLQPPEGRPAIPRCCLVLGPSFGDAALHAASAHFVVMTRGAALALSGPPVVGSATGEQVTEQELGGPEVALESGLAHLLVETEAEAFAAVTRFLSYLPDSAAFAPLDVEPVEPSRPAADLLKLVPIEVRRGYDVRHVIDAVADAGSVFQVRAGGARNLVTALARLEGRAVGLVANQPMQRGGVLDDRALAKELAFVELCDTFNVPLVFLHDIPGLMIGTQAEKGGIVMAYERVAARIAAATVPKVGVIIRKSYGGGNYAMGGRPTRPDLLFAWPSAELGFMAPETGVRTVHRRRLEQALAEGGQEAHDRLFKRLQDEWTHESEPWEAAAHLYVDDVIDPRETRRVIARGIEFAWGSRRPARCRGG
jgi:acetyl-CoA carboxylase carboxyltransferase component